jgi:hypothetical protein
MGKYYEDHKIKKKKILGDVWGFRSLSGRERNVLLTKKMQIDVMTNSADVDIPLFADEVLSAVVVEVPRGVVKEWEEQGKKWNGSPDDFGALRSTLHEALFQEALKELGLGDEEKN